MLTDEQLEVRARRCGSSDVGQILGLSNWGTPFDIWASKTGMVARKDEPETPEQKRGRILESAVADWYSEDTGAVLTRCNPLTLVGPEDWMCCSPDRWADNDGQRFGLECKTSKRNDGWAETGTEAFGTDASDLIGPRYAAQVLWMMECTGTDRWDVAVFFTFGDEFRRYTIRRNREHGAALVAHVRQWWDRHIVGGERPDVDGSDAAAAWLQQHFPRQTCALRDATDEESDLAEQLRQAEGAEKAAAAQAGVLKARLQLAIGDAEGLRGAFGKLTWRAQAGARRIDVERLRAEHPDIAEQYTTQGADIRVLRKQWK